MTDEDFENLSISSSDEWAILDDNSESNLVITDKFCSICGVELDQLVYKRACCSLCPVCYNCYQNYSCSTFTTQCEHMKETPHCIHALQLTQLSQTNGSMQANAHEGTVAAIKDNGYSQNEQKEATVKDENDFSRLRHVQQDQIDELPVSSSPRLIPFLPGFDAPSSGSDAAYHRYSLSWSDGEVVSSNSTDSDRQEAVATTAALGPSSGFGCNPVNDLTAKLANFEFAPACTIRCAPKPVPTSRPSGGSPLSAGFSILGNSAAPRSPPRSPPSPSLTSNHSSNCSGSPMNSAAQFFKSVVKHSATALNHFDFLPIHPWDGIERESSTVAGGKGAGPPVSISPTKPHRQERPAQAEQVANSTNQVAADPLLIPFKRNTLSDEKLRALIAPKTIPKCVFEASAYSLR